MRIRTLLASGSLALAVAVASPTAEGQQVPYAAQPQQQVYGGQPYQQPVYQPQPQPLPQAPGYAPVAAYPQAQLPQTTLPQALQQQAQLPPAQPPVGYYPSRPTVAPQAGQGRYAFLQDQSGGQAGSGTRTLPAPTEPVAQPAAPVQPAPTYQAPPTYAPAAPSGQAVVAHPPVQAAPVQWEGYTGATPAGGCATGGCATGGCGAGTGNYCYSGGGYNSGVECYAGNDYCDEGTRPQRQWFAGIYGLYMGRDNPNRAASAFFVETPPGAGSVYYPDPSVDLIFTTTDADVDFTGGAEVRLGSTFGCASDPCGCYSYQPFAWEIGYWGLAEDTSFGEVVDTDVITAGTPRLYGGINYAGLEYDRDGAGGTFAYRPLNDYYDYQAPIDGDSTNDIRVAAVRVTQTFQVQNLELNFWRFGSPSVGAAGGASGVSSGFGSGMLRRAIGGGANQCGYQGGCGGGSYGCGQPGCYDACGCEACGCEPAAPRRRFFINGLAGVRYLRLDETFRNAVFFTNTTSGTDATVYPGFMPTSGPDADQTVFHDIETDNDLLGFQLGCSMNCLLGKRVTLFCDSNFGIYGNQIDQYQRVFSPGGGVIRFVGSSANAAVRSSKEEVSFLGEARCGAGLQVSPRCRLTGAYRVIAVSGVALSTQQVETPLNEAAFGNIDSNGSIVIHGFQGGVEFKY